MTITYAPVDPAVLDYLEFVAPLYYNGSEPVVPLTDTDILKASAIAITYRPLCLPPDQQNEAQALYMAHLLTFRVNALSGTGTGNATVGNLNMEKEGDLQRQYTLSQSAIDGSGGTGYYDRWLPLWNRCGKIGRILVGCARVTPPVIDWANNPQEWIPGRWF